MFMIEHVSSKCMQGVVGEMVSDEWHFDTLDETWVNGRGAIRGKFTIDQVGTVDVRAIFEQEGETKHMSVLPCVPWFLISAFNHLHQEGVGLPHAGDKDETFRKAGSISRQNGFWASNQKAMSTRTPFSFNSLTAIDVGALIKRFLREMKMPLIGSHSRFLSELLEEAEKDHHGLEFDGVLNPLAGSLLFVLFNIHRLAHRGSTRMSTDSLSIIFAPSIIRPDRNKDKQKDLTTNESAVKLVQYLVQRAPFLQMCDYTSSVSSLCRSRNAISIATVTDAEHPL